MDKRRAIFLDRDGVINDIVDRGKYFFAKGKKIRWTAPFTYGEFRIKNGVKEALEKMKSLGFLLILITNQPDIAYGLMEKEEYAKILEDIKKLPLDDIFTCFHKRDENCSCKKPKTGLFLAAQEKWNIDFSFSFTIGDMESDMVAGRTVGCKTILIDGVYNRKIKNDFRIRNLEEAFYLICKYLI